MRRFYRSPKKTKINNQPHQGQEKQTPYQNQTPQKFFTPQVSSQSNDPSQGKKILIFIGCTVMIFLCQIINGVVYQRIYKVPYRNISSSSNDFYTDPITPMVFSTFFAAAIGYIRMDDAEAEVQIPARKMFKLAIMQISIHFGLTWALMNTSYILVVMANSCGLLSVILVGFYFQQTKDQTSYQPKDQITQNDEQNYNGNRKSSSKNIGPQKILICLIVCLGIFVFNYFAPNNNSSSAEKDSTTQSASLIILVVLGFVIFLQGLYPQFQTEIKQEYQPSSICFYYNVNKIQFVTVLIIGMITWQIPYSFQFILNHDELFLHIVVLALLNAFGVMFVYKIITLFRQHVYPLVSTVRKCITVTISILYFGHHINFVQFLGIILVFGGVLLQVLMNYNLFQKWDINLPFVNEQKSQRYVKNKHLSKLNGFNENKKRYEVYKVIEKQTDIEGI